MDVDGVVRDFHRGCLALINERMGTAHRVEDIRGWNIFRALGVPAATTTEIYDAMRAPGWCGALLPYEDAVEGVARLRRTCDVYPVTSPMRGSNRGPCAAHWTHETESWLRKHFGFDHDDVMHVTRKERVHGHFLIEDKASTLVKWEAEQKGIGILVDRVGDQYVGHKARDWREICCLVEAYG